MLEPVHGILREVPDEGVEKREQGQSNGTAAFAGKRRQQAAAGMADRESECRAKRRANQEDSGQDNRRISNVEHPSADRLAALCGEQPFQGLEGSAQRKHRDKDGGVFG